MVVRISHEWLRVMCLLALFGLLTGCTSIGSDYRDPRDPLESFNRTMYSFNEGLDEAVIKPVSQGYKAITPVPVDRGITNFFGNLSDIGSAVNNLLQFKLTRAVSDTGRVVINSTIGILGFFDVASNMNLEKYGEDFGQTLGVWGIGPGPYIVLPILGPSNGRDAIGRVVDWYLDPVVYVEPESAQYALHGVKLIDTRADLLGASRVMQEAALDPYQFVRDAYLQKRRNDIHDGNAPLDLYDEE